MNDEARKSRSIKIRQSILQEAHERAKREGKTVGLEGAKFNITSNAVLVGVAKTDAPLADDVRQKLENRILMRRLAEPQEIANAVAYLVSDEAQYMTGAVMNMLGGLDLFVF